LVLAGLFGWPTYNDMVIEGKETQSIAFKVLLQVEYDSEDGIAQAEALQRKYRLGLCLTDSLVAAQKAVEN